MFHNDKVQYLQPDKGYKNFEGMYIIFGWLNESYKFLMERRGALTLIKTNVMKTLLAFFGILLLVGCKETNTSENETTHDTNQTEIKKENADISNQLADVMSGMMERMHKTPRKGIADFDLAALMKEHHQGAIDMSTAYIPHATDERLKQMAEQIKAKQKSEMDALNEVMKSAESAASDYDPANTSSGLGKELSDNMTESMKMPKGDINPDKAYAVMMKKHHEDGIAMAEIISKYAKSQKLKELAAVIIADQKKEVEELSR